MATIELEVGAAAEAACRDLTTELERLAAAVVSELASDDVTLSVRLVNDAEIEDLNRRFRGRAEPTDVLSFPGETTPEGRHLGDVVISVETAKSQSGGALERELKVLLLHGILHCLGYDHETDDGEMEGLERRLRAQFLGPYKSGTVALLGRPNAGKSTLLNRILGEKLAIVSDKPQTTRHRLIGVLTTSRGQMALHDTPGLHRPLHRLNRRMVHAASAALDEADVACLLRDASTPFGRGEAFALDLLAAAAAKRKRPMLCLLNKIDRVAKRRLLPEIERYAARGLFVEIVPISALAGDGVDLLLDILWRLLPAGEPVHDPRLLTVHTERFLVAELIREKVLDQTRAELPYTTAVLIDAWEDADERTDLRASILVDKRSHKGIVIGRGGARIKRIGTAARHDLEDFLGTAVYLELDVRVQSGWREDSAVLSRLEPGS